MICISCHYEHLEKFCPNCGEKSDTPKITLGSILKEAVSTVTNMDRGFLYNIKALFLEPKTITSDYIRGKRKGILNPISYLVISITIYIIVISIFKAPPKELTPSDSDFFTSTRGIGVAIGLFLRTYIKYFWILSIVPLGLSLKIIYQKYTFLEHLTISSYIIGQATLVGVFSYLIFRFPLIFDPFVYFAIAWLSYRIFKDSTNKFSSFLLSAVSLSSFIVLLTVIVILIGFGISFK